MHPFKSNISLPFHQDFVLIEEDYTKRNIFVHLAVLHSAHDMLPLAAVSVQHTHPTKGKYNHAQPELSKQLPIPK